MTDNFAPTFDVQQALAYAHERRKRGLTESERSEWRQSLKELREEIPLQIKRQEFSAKTLTKRIDV